MEQMEVSIQICEEEPYFEALGMERAREQVGILQDRYFGWMADFEDGCFLQDLPGHQADQAELVDLMATAPTPFALGALWAILGMRREFTSTRKVQVVKVKKVGKVKVNHEHA